MPLIGARTNNTDSSIQNNEQFTFKDHGSNVLKNLEIHYQRRQLCDIVLCAGIDGRKVSAHRVVLSACSPYFSAMFNGSLRESNEIEVTLSDIEGEILELMINYCYTGCIELKDETVETILCTATMFQMDDVVNACCSYLTRQLHAANCIGITFFAERMNCQELAKHSEEFIVQNFLEVCRTDEFFQLNVEQLSKFLACDELNVAWEEDVFDIIMSWVQFDESSRKKYIQKLLSLLRFPLLSASFIAERVRPISEVNGCLPLILDALLWHLLPHNDTLLNEQITKPRINKLTTTTILDVTVRNEKIRNVSVESYSVQTNIWSIWKLNVFSGWRGFGWAKLGRKLYIVGGEDNRGPVGTATSIDLVTKTVIPLENLLARRSFLCLAANDNYIYAIGGIDANGKPLRSVERFPNSADTKVQKVWRFTSHMSQVRFNSFWASINNILYVFGGEDNRGILNVCESYNAKLNSWTVRSPMIIARACGSAVALNGYIYVAGGIIERPGRFTDTVERYNPETDEWIRICNLNIKGFYTNCYVLSGRLLALIAVEEADECFKTVKVYDDKADKWNSIEPLIYNRLMVKKSSMNLLK